VRPPKCRGLTLLEMLVVLVIVSLLSTLIAQGLGFFLGRFDAVRRLQIEALASSVQQTWFVNSVKNMVPLVSTERGFQGSPTELQGTSLGSLTGEPGVPRKLAWKIETAEEDSVELHYVEGPETDWRVLSLPSQTLRFEYGDFQGRWHDRWPPSGQTRMRIPNEVRLVRSDGSTVWLVNLELYPEPTSNFRVDF